jgi:hypothetical protein
MIVAIVGGVIGGVIGGGIVAYVITVMMVNGYIKMGS